MNELSSFVASWLPTSDHTHRDLPCVKNINMSEDPWTLHPILSPGDAIKDALWFVAHYTEEGAEPEGPTARVGHSCVAIDSKLFLFGGANPSGAFDDVHVFDLQTLKWTLPSVSGTKPCARYEHTGVHIDGTADMYVMFGAQPEGNLNDIYKLNTDTFEWSKIEAKGPVPSARTLHFAAAVGTKIYVFGGGHAGPDPVDDPSLHIFDTESSTWSSPATTGTKPSCRHGHTFCAYKSKLVMYGGMAGQELYNEVYTLDTDTLAWERLETKGITPVARTGHAACFVGDSMYVQGGMAITPAGPTALDDVLLFNLGTVACVCAVSNAVIETVTWSEPKLKCAPISSRLDHTLVAVPFACSEGDAEPVVAGLGTEASEVASEASAAAATASAPVIVDITDGFGVDGVPLPGGAETPKFPKSTNSATDGPKKKAGTPANLQPVAFCFGGMDTAGEMYNDALMIRCFL